MNWLNEFDECRAHSDQTFVVLRRLNKASDHAERKKLSDQLKQETSRLYESIRNLTEKLDLMSHNPEKYLINEGEITKRRSLLKAIKNKADDIEKQRTRGGTTSDYEDQRQALLNSSKLTDVTTIGEDSLDEHQLLREQKAMINVQDGQIHELSQTVGRIKYMGYAINDELEEHKRLLDELDGDVDKTQAALHSVRGRIQQMMTHASSGKLQCLLVFVLLLLIFVVWAIL
eukprot:c5248_g1_i1.p1 GENE.c5248_g1_i1~~c5248_g1_i1.p1  ORF type:complete len:230 (-),score=85.46 c5248_g1_i1:37-726(-)